MKKTIEQAVRKAARASGGDASAMIAAGIKAGIEEAMTALNVVTALESAEPEPAPRPNLAALAMDYFEAGDKVCVHTLEKTDITALALSCVITEINTERGMVGGPGAMLLDGLFSVTLTLEVQGTL